VKIQKVRTRVARWRGKTVPLPKMASLNSPMAEYFPIVDVEVGNELFWYVFEGEPRAKDGSVDLDERVPGLGLTVNERALEQFDVVE